MTKNAEIAAELKLHAGTFFMNGDFESSPRNFNEDGSLRPPAYGYFILTPERLRDLLDEAEARGRETVWPTLEQVKLRAEEEPETNGFFSCYEWLREFVEGKLK